MINIKGATCTILITIMFLLIPFGTFSNASSDPKPATEDDWYYLPGYPNYAPNGLPDFNQTQQKDWAGPIYPDCCGAVSLADILWWFDSKHEDPNGFPGDGYDNYSLVSIYNYLDNPTPGPKPDDHNFNNVNDNRTPWSRFKRGGEFIEQIIWLTYRHKNALWFRLLGPLRGTYTQFKLCWGVKEWIKETGQQYNYTVKSYFRPDFSFINECVRSNKGIILTLNGYDPTIKPFGALWGHCVAVAGINSSGEIAFSDPVRDRMNSSSSSTPYEHNDASLVSHDIWKVEFNTPWPLLSSWCIPSYCPGGVQVTFAIVISETE